MTAPTYTAEQVAAAVKAALEGAYVARATNQRDIMPDDVVRVAAMLIDALHVLDTEAIQIADATNNSAGIDGVQVLEDAEKIIKAAAGFVASELMGVAADPEAVARFVAQAHRSE